ncbi:MAG TPA: PilN domain-containing protein [Longimicrobiaceae bacterium]|nr:PilN domain-containing protein [Longimicrobiaceae bacterium]
MREEIQGGSGSPGEARSRGGSRLRVALVLGPGHASVVGLPGGSRDRAGTLHTGSVGSPEGDGGWPALAELLRGIREAAGARQGELALVVLRPLGQLKVLRLPPLRHEPLRQMVAQNAERFFPAEEGGLLTGLVRARVGWKGERECVVAAAGARRVEAASLAAAEAGFRVGSVTVGPAAALAGALSRSPAVGRGRTALALYGGGGFELLCLDRGRLRIARSNPAPPPPDDAERRLLTVVAEIRDRYGYLPDRVVIAGEGAPEGGASGEGIELTRVPELAGLSVEILAAWGAAFPAAGTPLLLREPERIAVRQRQRRRTGILCTLSAALLGTTGAMHLAQLHGEVEALRSRRERMAPAVAEALRLRGEVRFVRTRVETLAGLEAERPRWVEILATLADALPSDAHLTSLALSGGELRLDGQARSATALVPVFESEPWVRSARLGSPVRREQTPAGARERFSLTLEVRPGRRPGSAPGGGRR